MYLPTIYIFEDYESTNCYAWVIKSQINARDLSGEFKEYIQGILQHFSFMMLKFQAQKIYHAAGYKIRQYMC